MSDRKREPVPPLVHADRIPLESLGLALLFLGIFVLLSPAAFYKADGQHLVRRLIERNSEYPHHPFYMPMLIAFGDLLAPLGLSPFQTARLFSQVGGALAIALAHAGFRLLGLRPWVALLATLLVAFCPAIFFFSNVVEFHAPFLAAASLAFVVFAAALRRQPGSMSELLIAALLGLATSAAAGMHASGILLPAIFVPWWLVLRYREGLLVEDRKLSWPALAAPLLAGLAHGAGLALFVRVQRSGEFLQQGFQHPQGIEHLPGIFVQEWLLPFLPLSLLPFLLLLGRRFRLEAGFVLLAISPYLLAALRLLVGDSESGAYLLPLAIPTAWLTASSLAALRNSHELGKHAKPLGLSLLVISALLALARLEDFDRPEAYRPYAASLRACIGTEDALVILGHPDAIDEYGAVLIELPRLRVYLADEPTKYSAAQVRQAFAPALRATLAKEKNLYITNKALEFLDMPEANLRGGGGRAFVELLRRLCDFEPIHANGFVVYRLKLK